MGRCSASGPIIGQAEHPEEGENIPTQLTQATVNRIHDDHPPGSQVYDAEVSGQRIVVGKRGSSFKFVGRINDGTDRYVSVVLGRTSDVSLRSAGERSVDLRQQLRSGADPRRPKASTCTMVPV